MEFEDLDHELAHPTDLRVFAIAQALEKGYTIDRIDVYKRQALVHPDVAFYLYSKDAELFNLPVMPLRQRILAIFGKKLNQQLLSEMCIRDRCQIHPHHQCRCVGKPSA